MLPAVRLQSYETLVLSTSMRQGRTQRFDDLDIDEDDLCAAIAEASNRRQRNPLWMIAWFLAFLIAAQYGTVGFMIAAGAFTVAVIALVTLPMRGAIDDHRAIRAALNRRGYRLCINCGYSLEGLDDDVQACPECGEAPPSQHC